jgi:hypothetical protein
VLVRATRAGLPGRIPALAPNSSVRQFFWRSSGHYREGSSDAVKSVADALVGRGVLAVDAVGVDLEQDSNAVAGAAGDLGGGHADIEPQGRQRQGSRHPQGQVILT